MGLPPRFACAIAESRSLLRSPAAKTLCANSTACQGFTFQAWDRSPNASESIKVAFKTTSRVVPEGDPEGLQPPPIPDPGDKGNTKPGQPGLPSYGSQVCAVIFACLYFCRRL